MREALAIVSEEGLEKLWQRHQDMHHRCAGGQGGAAGRGGAGGPGGRGRELVLPWMGLRLRQGLGWEAQWECGGLWGPH